MSTGNLIGTIVAADFWPRCENCVRYESCRQQPRHPAFPHTWPWGYEAVYLLNGERLVTLSWVGDGAIGEPHTGCTVYAVADGHARLPDTATEERLLETWQEIFGVEARLQRAEAAIDDMRQAGREEAADALWGEIAHVYDELDALHARASEMSAALVQSGQG
ncbi:MAG: hypothetical protein H8D78_04920 [Chloroflexi bacterium]|nr:hypothetical protein [Chloroflexota bacterium]